jgi:hypothetical protein
MKVEKNSNMLERVNQFLSPKRVMATTFLFYNMAVGIKAYETQQQTGKLLPPVWETIKAIDDCRQHSGGTVITRRGTHEGLEGDLILLAFEVCYAAASPGYETSRWMAALDHPTQPLYDGWRERMQRRKIVQ